MKFTILNIIIFPVIILFLQHSWTSINIYLFPSPWELHYFYQYSPSTRTLFRGSFFSSFLATLLDDIPVFDSTGQKNPFSFYYSTIILLRPYVDLPQLGFGPLVFSSTLRLEPPIKILHIRFFNKKRRGGVCIGRVKLR